MVEFWWNLMFLYCYKVLGKSELLDQRWNIKNSVLICTCFNAYNYQKKMFPNMSVMPPQYLFISYAKIIILPTYFMRTSFLCYIDIFILWSFIVYHICLHMPSHSGLHLSFCNLNWSNLFLSWFCQFRYFSDSALVHSHSGLFLTYCNFGHICCFHPFCCPMTNFCT